jgi:hypothetical protein
MLAYYSGWDNGPSKPVTNKDWRKLHCSGCGIEQTHSKSSIEILWRCVICSSRRHGEEDAKNGN